MKSLMSRIHLNKTIMKISNKILHWAPRIICILAILFISMFSLDAFGSNKSLGEQLLDWVMHMLPSFVFIALLILAWYKEFVGGIIFISLSVLFSVFVFLINFNRNQFSLAFSLLVTLVIGLPFVLVGVLFLLNHSVKKKIKQSEATLEA